MRRAATAMRSSVCLLAWVLKRVKRPRTPTEAAISSCCQQAAVAALQLESKGKSAWQRSPMPFCFGDCEIESHNQILPALDYHLILSEHQVIDGAAIVP